MYKKLLADKDSYITNKIIKNERRVSASVGQAATLDLFKLYGATKTGAIPNTELSRLLVHFDLSDLKKLFEENKIDINDSSFWCNLILKDVYGGQTTPINFNIDTFPLSASFSEGIGRDVVYYCDTDVCNWISSSIDVEWFNEGCNFGAAAITPSDYIVSSENLPTTYITQKFSTGEEDLIIDVTTIISATLTNELPDEGFRISFSAQIEDDQHTYFVKRFGSRQIYDETKRPTLVFGFDDSITDDTQNLYFDEDAEIKLYNYSRGQLKNLTDGNADLTGSDCLKLKLSLLPAKTTEFYFTGSQQTFGSCEQTGIYTSKIFLSANEIDLTSSLQSASSLEFIPVWMNFNETITFSTGSKVEIKLPQRSSARKDLSKYNVTAYGIKDQYSLGQEENVRINIFDYTDPFIKVVKLPVELPGIVVRNAYYSVREIATNFVSIPFDVEKKSTRISSDSKGMFFNLDTSNLIAGRTYTIDVLIDDNGKKQYFYDVSSNFRVTMIGA